MHPASVVGWHGYVVRSSFFLVLIMSHYQVGSYLFPGEKMRQVLGLVQPAAAV